MLLFIIVPKLVTDFTLSRKTASLVSSPSTEPSKTFLVVVYLQEHSLGRPKPRHWRYLGPCVPTGSNLWRTMSRVRDTRRPPSRYRSPPLRVLASFLFLTFPFLLSSRPSDSLFVCVQSQKTGSWRELLKRPQLPDRRTPLANGGECLLNGGYWWMISAEVFCMWRWQ